MIAILTIVVFICRWYGIHIRIPKIGINCMIFAFSMAALSAYIVEPYHPERLLRQLGKIQIIRHAPVALKKIRRGSSGSSIMCP